MRTDVQRKSSGFTLIEISIVLVIIGLIIGGVLVGQDLINAAAVRAQVAQIEKYNTAVNTFRGKYNDHLPGDIPNPDATNFGFVSRGQYAGEGDGNGILETYSSVSCPGTGGTTTNSCGWGQGLGETSVFWVDLFTANLIDQKLSTATPSSSPGIVQGISLNLYFPQAKIGNGNYLYVYSVSSINYLGLIATQNIGVTSNCAICQVGTVGLTVSQAYNIDLKTDDGLPQSGHVMTMGDTSTPGANGWAAGGGLAGALPGSTANVSATSCYDNGGNSSSSMRYSMGYNNGAGVNCWLNFLLQ